MYNFDKDDFNKNGNYSKSEYHKLSPFDRVLAYIKNWDKSKGYKYCIGMGQVRTRLIHSYLRNELDYVQQPKLEEAMNVVHENFEEFKKWLNSNHENGTLNKHC